MDNICECNGKIYADRTCLLKHQETDSHKNNYIAKLLKERENSKYHNNANISSIKSDINSLRTDINSLKIDTNSIKSDTNSIKSDISSLLAEMKAMKMFYAQFKNLRRKSQDYTNMSVPVSLPESLPDT